MSATGEFTLTYTQRHALEGLCQRQPRTGWHGSGSRTMRRLQRLGLVDRVVVQRDKCFWNWFDWRATAAGKAETRRHRRAIKRAVRL